MVEPTQQASAGIFSEVANIEQGGLKYPYHTPNESFSMLIGKSRCWDRREPMAGDLEVPTSM
eukprot:12067062-Ditylum_brightwellii.AAC.1